MSKSLYAFYGSLRRGMRLHNQFKSDLHYSHSVWLKGYDLYSLGNYPFAIKSSDSSHKILVEITEILNAETEKTFMILKLEQAIMLKKFR